MNGKRKGTRNEHRSMAILEAAGYRCTRARGRYCLEHCPACNGGEDEENGVPPGCRDTGKTGKRKGNGTR